LSACSDSLSLMSDNGNRSCSFSPLATLWTGVTDSFTEGKLPLSWCILVHIVIICLWRVKWSDDGNMSCFFDNGNMSCSYSPLATLWNGVTDSFTEGKLPLSWCIFVHVVIICPWWVKWSDDGNMSCFFPPLATLWNGVIRLYSAGKLPLNRRICACSDSLSLMSEMISFAPFSHLLHCELGWLTHSQEVSCLWIDVFDLVLFHTFYTVKLCDTLFSLLFCFCVLLSMQTEEQKKQGRPGNKASEWCYTQQASCLWVKLLNWSAPSPGSS